MPQNLKICDLTVALARLGGNPSLLKELVQFFREDSPKLIEGMKQAVEHSDAAALHRAAHSMRGLVVNFDAEATESAARALEQMALSGNRSAADAAVCRLER